MVTYVGGTEEMIAEVNKANDIQGDDDLIIGSADVVALYPSLDIGFTINKVCEVFYESSVKVEDVDYDELGLYLVLTMKPEELEELNLTDVCPTRKSNRGRPPTIIARSKEEKKEERFRPWNMPNKQPDEYTKRVMFREAMRVVLAIIMNNHVYTFDNEIRKQVRGGPIGLQLTGVLAQTFMIWWDKEFAARLKEFGIGKKLNERYADDINIATRATPLGMRYKDGKVFVDDQLVT